MFKLIPSVVQGSWIVRQAVGNTPVLLGRKLATKYFRWDLFHPNLCFRDYSLVKLQGNSQAEAALLGAHAHLLSWLFSYLKHDMS